MKLLLQLPFSQCTLLPPALSKVTHTISQLCPVLEKYHMFSDLKKAIRIGRQLLGAERDSKRMEMVSKPGSKMRLFLFYSETVKHKVS